jgi:hypothetical protein
MSLKTNNRKKELSFIYFQLIVDWKKKSSVDFDVISIDENLSQKDKQIYKMYSGLNKNEIH